MKTPKYFYFRVNVINKGTGIELEDASDVDVVEVVRCKDCKHWIPYDWMFSEIWQSRNMADYPEEEIGCDCCDMAMKANDFCSRPERREVTE
jgi:hypothetical protein